MITRRMFPEDFQKILTDLMADAVKDNPHVLDSKASEVTQDNSYCQACRLKSSSPQALDEHIQFEQMRTFTVDVLAYLFALLPKPGNGCHCTQCVQLRRFRSEVLTSGLNTSTSHTHVSKFISKGSASQMD